jgi:hypothetical protein
MQNASGHGVARCFIAAEYVATITSGGGKAHSLNVNALQGKSLWFCDLAVRLEQLARKKLIPVLAG